MGERCQQHEYSVNHDPLHFNLSVAGGIGKGQRQKPSGETQVAGVVSVDVDAGDGDVALHVRQADASFNVQHTFSPTCV